MTRDAGRVKKFYSPRVTFLSFKIIIVLLLEVVVAWSAEHELLTILLTILLQRDQFCHS